MRTSQLYRLLRCAAPTAVRSSVKKRHSGLRAQLPAACLTGLLVGMASGIFCTAQAQEQSQPQKHSQEQLQKTEQNEPSLLDFDLDASASSPASTASASAASPSRFSHEVSLYTLLDRKAQAQHLRLGWRGVYENTSHPVLHSYLEARVHVDMAHMTGAQHWSTSTRRQYEWDSDIGRAWLRYAVSPYSSLTIGRNVTVHGNADLLRQMDVVNTLDLRYPGNSDLHELRMPRGMLEYRYSRDIDVSATVAFEQTFSALPAAGSHFALTEMHIPRNRRRYYGASDYIINIKAEALGLVHQFQVARYLYGSPVILPAGSRSGTHPAQPVQHFYRVQQTSVGSRYTGQAVELYSEFSHIRPASRGDPRPAAASWLLGAVWRGIANTQLQLEAADNAFENQRQYAFHFRRSWMNDRLTATAAYVKTQYRSSSIGLGQPAAHGALLSLSADYEISDTSSLEAKWVLFRQSPGSPLRRWDRKDYFSLKYTRYF